MQTEKTQKMKTKTYNKLTKEEKEEIEYLRYKEPNALEKEIVASLWQEKISKKGLDKWFRKLEKNGENVMKITGQRENYIKIDKNRAVKFSISSLKKPKNGNLFDAALIATQNLVKNEQNKGFETIAILDSLRIGDFENKENQQKLVDIIKGIAQFSKNTNIPVVGGEMFFNYSFNEIPILNIFSVGIKDLTKKKKKAVREGQSIYLINASKNNKNLTLKEKEQKLFDLCKILEEQNRFTLAENVGKGGIIKALDKMLKGKKRGTLFIDKIKPSVKKKNFVKVLTEEKPARMLFVVNKTNKEKFNEIVKISNVNLKLIGEITRNIDILVLNGDKEIAHLPSDVFENNNMPERNIRYKKPDRTEIKEYSIKDVPMPSDLKEVAWFLLKHKNISSKKHLIKQFNLENKDSNTNEQLSDASIIPLDAEKSLIVGVDCNSRYVNACPQTGAAIAVAEAARNIVCSGGKPIGISACINIGNYKNPEIFWQFTEIIKGINKVSREYKIPVLNIKTNFDNYTTAGSEEKNIFPTPTIGMLGILENKNRLNLNFKNKGDMIFLLGETKNSISSSLYLKSYHKIKNSPPPNFSLKIANKLQNLVAKLAETKLINSAHDVSNGGLIITLIEAAIEKNLGFDITTDAENRDDAFLFGEAQNRIIVTVNAKNEIDFVDFMIEQKFPFLTLGHVTKGDLRIDDVSWGDISEAKDIFENSLERNLKV